MLALAVSLAVCLGTITPYAEEPYVSMDGEDIATGIYDVTPGSTFVRDQDRLEAVSGNFAQALAQDYRPVEGTSRLTKDSRFYIIKGSEDTGIPADLESTVSVIRDWFRDAGIPSKAPLKIVSGPAEGARPGDILISLESPGRFVPDFAKDLGNTDASEAYKLSAGEMFEVRACTEDGIYYGLITLHEILSCHETGKDGIEIDSFRITDAPDLEERTIFIDCARKYFSKDWLEAFIRRSSFMRYNTIVLHFSEAEGIRLDSDAFPWLTDGIKSLTREEMTEIVETAGLYHMNVIPSIDTPGHNRYMVSKYEEYVKKHKDFSFTYDGKTYNRKTKGFSTIANHYSRDGVTLKVTDIGIDITKAHSVAFSNALIDDYARFFRSLGCREFDICGDEIMGWSNFMLGDNEVSYERRWLFLEHWRKFARKNLDIKKGSSSDTFISYLNSMIERLEGMGYTCRVFNDEIDINKDQHIDLTPSAGVTCWDMSVNQADHFARKGHTVYNGVMQWCYYVVRKIDGKDIMKNRYKTVNAENIYDNWDPRSFSARKNAGKYVEPARFGGAYFFIWCDNPKYKSADTIWKETELRMWANSSRMWNPEVNSSESGIRAAMPYEEFKDFATRAGSYPGYKED